MVAPGGHNAPQQIFARQSIFRKTSAVAGQISCRGDQELEPEFVVYFKHIFALPVAEMCY